MVNGFRMQKYASGGTDTYYINDPTGKTEAVQTGTANGVYTYNIWGNDMLGQVKDNAGSLTRYYYPFGMQMPGRNQAGTADGRFKFISVEQDVETGLDAMGFRSYDPWSGGFGQTDPLDFLSPSESPYAYCFNNSISYSDPFGLDTMLTYFPNPNGGYDLKSHWIPDNICTPENQGQATDYDQPQYTSIDDWWDNVQKQSAEQAKKETNDFYRGIFQGTAKVADLTADVEDYSILGEAVFGQEEAIPISFAIATSADIVSTVAKAGLWASGDPGKEFLRQLALTGVNLATLRMLRVSQAGLKLANDPVAQTVINLTLDQLVRK